MPLLKLFTILTLISFEAHSRELILFERGRNINLSSSFNEVTAYRRDPPRFYINREGYLTYAGDGDFGVLYTKKKFSNFILNLRVVVPGGRFQYANSGIFFRHADPLAPPPGAPAEVLDLARTRTPSLVAEWSSYEVQLLSGRIAGDPVNKLNGSFYGVPTSQQALTEYRLDPGETYDIQLKVTGRLFEVSMKWVNQQSYVLVSRMRNMGPKSSLPGHVGLQSYYSNGNEVKALLFERIGLTPLP